MSNREDEVRERLAAADNARPSESGDQSYLNRSLQLRWDIHQNYFLFDIAISMRQIVILLDDIRRRMK